MEFIWDETKRQANLKKHGLDFADAKQVFTGPMHTFEDARDAYGEQRMIGVGLLAARVVLVVHVESGNEIRILSMRKAEKNEIERYYRSLFS
ncbi:MAG: BrnT family toxin [Candidatus Accumulibacter sp.]|jgi:uncharacterized DUF497 family protein|nr:BrnT family toxin [Accumulibacter sp.]